MPAGQSRSAGRVRFLVVLLQACAFGQVPPSISAARSIFRSKRVNDEVERFFAPGGPSDSWRVAVDRTCVQGALAVASGSSSRADLLDSKWSLDLSLPRMLARSRWGFDEASRAAGHEPNATVVVFGARKSPRRILSLCRRVVARKHARSKSRLWFVASTGRGRCCDGGQLRDPALLGHSFLTVASERAKGPWLFRENNFKKHSWRSPVTRDTAPQIRCFDDSIDVSLPPPAHLIVTPSDISNSSLRKEYLVMHAESGQGPPEYDLRRALTMRWAPDWPWGKTTLEQSQSMDPTLFIRKKVTAEEHDRAMRTSRYCLVVEGFAPWTPRLTEAIKRGCVPAIMSPSYRPPFASLLDWRKFAVFLAAEDIPDLPTILQTRFDYDTLHKNLLKVQSLFRYCLDDPDCAPDALPLLVFEMARRKTPPRHKQTGELTGIVSALTTENQQPKRSRVEYTCSADASSCRYTLKDKAFNCSTRTEMACGCVEQQQPQR